MTLTVLLLFATFGLMMISHFTWSQEIESDTLEIEKDSNRKITFVRFKPDDSGNRRLSVMKKE